MAISIAEQLEAFTTFRTHELLARYGVEISQGEQCFINRSDVRPLFTFTRNQLVGYLQSQSDLSRALLAKAESLCGVYDKDVLARHGDQYVLYWQDHSARRFERFYDNLGEGVADWLSAQHGISLSEGDA